MGTVVERIAALDGLVDQILVVDGNSSDDTVRVASAAGAQVAAEADLMPDMGPVLGKGDAMWRSLAAVTGEVVAFIDADTRDFDARFVNGLVGPLLTDPRLRFVKATYRRPFTAGGLEVPGGGGRVSQLDGPPLLAAFYPELAALTQPLAGEVAATRELLESIPFATGYAVEMAMLLDVYERRAPRRWPSATSASGATTTSRWTRCGRWPRRSWPWCASTRAWTPPGRDRPAAAFAR